MLLPLSYDQLLFRTRTDFSDLLSHDDSEYHYFCPTAYELNHFLLHVDPPKTPISSFNTGTC
jgi:hypothetical protein